MQAISLHPQQRLLVNKRIALYVLVVLIGIAPALSLPLTMLLPLFICPLLKGKKSWIAWLAIPLPALIVLLRDGQAAYAASLLLLVAAPALVTWRMKADEYSKPESILVYIAVMALTLGFSLWALYLDAWQEGVGLAAFLSEKVEQWVMTHPQRTELLYRALSAGLLPLPQGYQQVTLLNLTLDPVFLGEIRLMLKTRVAYLVDAKLPTLFVQAAIILGVFINLRIQRMWGSYLLLNKAEPNKVSIALAPCFSRLRMPRKWRVVMLICCLSYFLISATQGFGYRLAQVLYATFETAYQLQGAAMVCFLIMGDQQEKRVLAGIAGGLLFVAMPFAAFVAGCFEGMFSFRSRAGDDKNEREKNEEEEP